MSRSTQARNDPVTKLLLAVGFLSVSAATLVAHTSPAAGYEVSLYTMTPASVWIGLGVAVMIALFVSVFSIHDTVRDHGTTRSVRATALFLGGMAMTVFVSLPIIRGYHYNGHNDSLTHLGWATAISEQSLSPFELFYPGIHTVSTVIESAIGFSMPHAILLFTVLSALTFFIFVPLSVQTIRPSAAAVTVGAFASFLLLPITTISTDMYPHAMSQTILLSALFVFVILKYLLPSRPTSNRTAFSYLLAIVSAPFVVYHPQFVAHMLVVLTGICGVQFVASRLETDRAIATYPKLYAQTSFLAVVFAVWILNNQSVAGFALDAVSSAILYILSGGGGAGESIASQGASIAAIGSSIEEVFLRLFLPQLLFSLLAVLIFFAAIVQRWPADQRDVSSVAISFGVALAGLFVVFSVYFFSDTSEMYFRVFGLMMVFVTILGALVLTPLVDRAVRATGGRTVNSLLVAGFGMLLVVSLIAVFPSPFIYNQSHQVTEGEMSGYERAFENADDELTFLGIRDAPNRYNDAVNANRERSSAHGMLNETATEQGLSAFYDEDMYLTVSQTDRDRETIAYQGLRYTDGDFGDLTTQQEVDRVQSNGQLEVYFVRAG